MGLRGRGRRGSSRPESRVYLLEELRHLAHQTGVALHLALVSVGQEKVPQQGRVCQRLDDTVHKAGVAQVDQPSQAWKKRQKER